MEFWGKKNQEGPTLLYCVTQTLFWLVSQHFWFNLKLFYYFFTLIFFKNHYFVHDLIFFIFRNVLFWSVIRSGVQSMIYPVRSDLGFRDFKQGERGRRQGLQNPQKDWGENAIVAGISKQLSSHYKTPLMTSLKEVRNQLLIRHDDGVINDKGTIMLTLRTILILVLTSMIWKTTRAFQSFAPTRTTYHFWLKIPEIVECHQRSICSGLEALCIFLESQLSLSIFRHDSSLWEAYSSVMRDKQLHDRLHLPGTQSQNFAVDW